MPRKLATAAALGLGLTCVAVAGPDDKVTLNIGDKAPPIDITHWIKGVEVVDRKPQVVSDFEKGKVYVLEFWATWCGPCVASMPHLSKLQEKYKDYGVTIIGVSDEPLATVVPFLFKEYKQDGLVQNERIRYTLTTDPDESVKNDYFRAAGRTGIPCAFIIGKDARVEWIGHPAQIDEPLEAVVRDTWDRSTYQAQAKREQEMKAQFRAAFDKKDWDTVLAIYDKQLAEDSDNLDLHYGKFQFLLLEKKDVPKAYAAGYLLMDAAWDNPQILNAIAWTVVDNKDVPERQLDFARRAALRANELTKSADAAILDTVARVYYEMGDMHKAVEWQKKAAKNAGDDAMGAEIRKTLEKYEKAKK